MKLLKRIKIFLNQPKIFCIGMNKTGTTTINKVFKRLNFRTAPQIKQEKFIGDVNDKIDFEKIKKFCWKYNFFQDLPFSQGDFYKTIHKIYPNSKFILTIREANRWFDSLCNFHLLYFKKMGINLSDISEVDQNLMQKFDWIKKGYYYNYTKKYWISEKSNNNINYNWKLLYDRGHYISVYKKRNEDIIEYFGKKNLLIINLSEEKDISKILSFLNLPKTANFELPHELKSIY